MTAHIAQSIDQGRGLATVSVVGSVTAEQVSTQIVSFLTDHPTPRVLWDLRRGSIGALSSDDMREILAAGAPYADARRGGKTAILCATALDFGLARMFETLASVYHMPFAIHVFLDESQAEAWLFS